MTEPPHIATPDARLLHTQQAFDDVASEYDGPRGNNALVRKMRDVMWRTLTDLFAPGDSLTDLGCGTGLDAAYMGGLGYRITALDWSPEMVRATQARLRDAGLEGNVDVRHVGIHELENLNTGPFDGMYSNLGALNCVPDMAVVADECARLLKPGGRLVASVIGRYCPWETAFYLLKRNPERALVRFRKGMVPVGLNGGTVWTRYYTPREFYRPFERSFDLTHVRALGLLSPPPYLIAFYRQARRLCDVLARADDHIAGLPGFRNFGDHFLIVLTKRGDKGDGASG